VRTAVSASGGYGQNHYQFQYSRLSIYYAMAAIFIIMNMKVQAALIAFLLLGILLIFGISRPASGSGLMARDSSSTTFLGMNTGNMTLNDLLASVPGGLISSGTANITAVSNGTPHQSQYGDPNVTLVDVVRFPPADGEVCSPEGRQDENHSLSGVRTRFSLLLSLTALLFLISHSPLGKRSRMSWIRR
jgi:hypothetical protein